MTHLPTPGQQNSAVPTVENRRLLTARTDHSINAHPQATLRHVPTQPSGRYDETGLAPPRHEYVQVA